MSLMESSPTPPGTPDASSPADGTELPFEELLARLEVVASRLEDPETDLETALRLYEDGVSLARQCTERLRTAELRITEFKNTGDEMVDVTNAKP